MKTLFLESKYTGKVDLNRIRADLLPPKIGLITAVQFAYYLKEIKAFLLKNKKKVFIGKGKQKYKGQMLGCDVGSALKIKDKVDAFLYIGSGEFHPLFAGVKTGKDIFIFDPITNNFTKINNNEISVYKKKKRGALLKFLSAENVGILVSTKSGQYYNTKKLDLLKKQYPKKKFYTFIADAIDYTQLENFPFIEAWVNTACPRIEEDFSVVNIEDLK